MDENRCVCCGKIIPGGARWCVGVVNIKITKRMKTMKKKRSRWLIVYCKIKEKHPDWSYKRLKYCTSYAIGYRKKVSNE